MMLVDGPTLNAQRAKEDSEDVSEAGTEVPVFHTRGLCMSKVWGKLSHVTGTQRGYSQLHKQPSLDATLRPADLTARKVEVGACTQLSLNDATMSKEQLLHCSAPLQYGLCGGGAPFTFGFFSGRLVQIHLQWDMP